MLVIECGITSLACAMLQAHKQQHGVQAAAVAAPVAAVAGLSPVTERPAASPTPPALLLTAATVPAGQRAASTKQHQTTVASTKQRLPPCCDHLHGAPGCRERLDCSPGGVGWAGSRRQPGGKRALNKAEELGLLETLKPARAAIRAYADILARR